MKLPSIDECEAMLKEYEVPANVMAHTQKVRLVANFLAKRIFENNNSVDSDLVDRAALLHDIAKLYCIENNCRHAHEAEKILREKGYPELGKIVKLHGLEEVNSFAKETPLEAKIVWYADKRVNHDKLVSMSARYTYLRGHYGSMGAEKMREINSTEQNALALERELFKLAGLKRDILEDDLNG